MLIIDKCLPWLVTAWAFSWVNVKNEVNHKK